MTEEREDEGGAMLPAPATDDHDELPGRLRAMYQTARVAFHITGLSGKTTEVFGIHATQDRMQDLRRAAAAIEYLSGEEKDLRHALTRQGEILHGEVAALRGEAGVLRSLLKEAAGVLDTISDEDAEDGGESLRALKQQIEAALAATIHG